MKGNKKRIDFVDLAKGCCIILVVIGHCGVSKNKSLSLNKVRMKMDRIK